MIGVRTNNTLEYLTVRTPHLIEIYMMKCPHCQNEDESLIEWVSTLHYSQLRLIMHKYLCNNCSKTWDEPERKNKMTPLAWKPQSNEVHRAWINAIIDEAQDSLSTWEMGFITSITTIVEKGWGLSQKQEEILERIYAEKTK